MISLEKTLMDKSYKIIKIDVEPTIQRRFFDVGIVPGATIERVLVSPFGGISAYFVMGTTIGIRDEDVKGILVSDEAL